MKLIQFVSVLTLVAATAAFAETKPNAARSVAGGAGAANACATGIKVRNNEKVAFLGDSITQFGADMPGGYVRLVISGLEANGVSATAIPAGISGNKSNQMLERLESSVLSKKPDWLTLSCGVNDVWHGEKGVPLDQYKVNITAIVDKAQAAGVKVMILTATMIGEDAANPNNVKLGAYNDFLRQLAREKQCPLADLNGEMQAALKPVVKGRPQQANQLTRDGVHMNPFGDQMMATGVLRAFGMSASQLQKAHDFWMNMPQAACAVTVKAGLTLRQYKELSELAAKENRSVEDMVNAEVEKSMKTLTPSGK